MQITVDKDLFPRIQEAMQLDSDTLRYSKSVDINLPGQGKQLNNILDILSKCRDFSSGKRAFQDALLWKKAVTGSSQVVAKTCKQMFSMLAIELAAKSKRRHIYRQSSSGAGFVFDTYYISEIEYEPPKKRDGYVTQAYIVMTAVFQELGQVKTEFIQFDAAECVGKTAQQLLGSRDYLIESDELRNEYERQVARFHQIKPNIGEQYLARGTAIAENQSSWMKSHVSMTKGNVPAKVVIDIDSETDEKQRSYGKPRQVNTFFWDNLKQMVSSKKDEDAEYDEDATQSVVDFEIPTHTYVKVFDLNRHERVRIHIQNLEKYIYDDSLDQVLILPKSHRHLMDVLLCESSKDTAFEDVIKNKSGGVIILCQGIPGTGKTLTAEIYAEKQHRPLYVIQCAQLGVSPEELENNLKLILDRGSRWNAVVLLDEADVYVTSRGSDLIQNAIVGVFLRVLEYHQTTIFLTTNRGDLVDDAILSRCTVRIPYSCPTPEDQKSIWKNLAITNKIDITPEEIDEIVSAHSNMTGRDIKNTLKLAAAVCRKSGSRITVDLINELKLYKPTGNG
jgi:SpoVK/Ycf46/Vps4 family AAA+-type ATPase